MSKILLLTEIFPPAHGGSGRWFSEIYGRLPKGSVCCVVGKHPRDKEYDQYFQHSVYRTDLSCPEWGVKSIRGIRFYAGLWRTLRDISKKEGVTELHCGRCLPEGVVALLLRLTNRLPYRCYVHGEDVETALTSRELTWLTRQVMRHAKEIICNSENSYRILQEKWQLPKDKLVVMNPGVDTDKFILADNSVRPQAWQGKVVILTVGRLQKRKGQDMMIRALPLLKRRFSKIHYAIVGGGEERANLEALAKELEVESRVEFLGEPEDDLLVHWYQQCDVFALPNRRVGNDDEGFGMVLLEAQSCGKPVLAGAAGGTHETLVDDVTGVLVDCTTPETLTVGMTRLLEDNRSIAVIGAAGRKHVEGTFSWEILALQAKKIFQITE